MVKDAMMAFMEILFNLASAVGLPYYGVAIIIFTILIKILLYPLTWKQMSSMRRMMEIQPKMAEIQKKYANNKQMMNEKVMDLYSREGVSPYAGCLPIIVQLPILWIFYRMLMTFPYGDDASAWFLGFNLTQAYGISLSYHLVLPVFAGITTYFMSKVSTAMSQASKPPVNTAGKGKKGKAAPETPNPAEKTQKMMLIFMPFFMAYIVATVPSGLGLYIITMNLMSIAQTVFINKKLQREKELREAAQ